MDGSVIGDRPASSAVAVGVDLNGVRDRCLIAGAGRESFVGPPGPVVVPIGSNHVLTGDEAIASFHGRGWPSPPEAADVQPRLPVLAMIQRIGRHPGPESYALDLVLGHHIRSIVPPRVRSCVLAVPDLPEYDEDVRNAFIESAGRVGLDLKLLWRPVAAVLGWGEDATPNELAHLHDAEAIVVQILPDGIAATGLRLEILPLGGALAVVPVRRRDDLRTVVHYDGGNLAALLRTAAEIDADGDPGVASQILWSTGCYWNPMAGLDAVDGLVRGTGGCWRVIDGSRTLPEPVAVGMTRAIHAFCERHATALRHAGLVIVEGPLAGAALADGIDATTPLTILAEAIRALRPDGSPVVSAPPERGLVALGCAVYGRRRALGQTSYFDFLPAIEINAIRDGRHCFVHLVEPSARVEGGMTYERSLLDRFEVTAGTEELEFYLLKQDEAAARHSLVRFANPPMSDVRVAVHVTQVPAQGHARVEVRPDAAGALGTAPVLLDWGGMEAIEQDRDAILEILNGKGSYPIVTPQEAHICLWTWVRANGGSLRKDLYDFLRIGAPDAANAMAYKRFISGRFEKTFAVRAAPMFATGGADPDRRPYTLFSSDGRPPAAIGADPGWTDLLQAVLAKLDSDYGALFGAPTLSPTQQSVLRVLRKIATFTFGACPPTVRGSFRRMCIDNAPDRRATMYMGRVLRDEADLAVLFTFLSERAWLSMNSGKALNSDIAKAAADVLAFHESAGAVLMPEQADTLAEFAKAMLDDCADHRRPQRYAGALRLTAFLLRHRMRRHDFLYPDASDEGTANVGRKIESQLKAFKEKIAKTSYGLQHDAAIDEILALLRHRGKGLRIDIDDETSEDGGDSDE
ncbi:hypothetical protein VY88_10150 [Azospirillum thiophilum]|uniref:Uncharacterized protein n=1 Tax=Azospirillum thiophilum TaxID=528244 RepID=A0AAC8VUV1_9PROT|nr:hypothetical protein [Azospirillum thiophilum]ALG69988.1 hypothetical protein AL072_02565 [Azospirillum thiophilum]KJR66328.1 hypothetical protein VY88_10150 [Azospirillum thiophilum]